VLLPGVGGAQECSKTGGAVKQVRRQKDGRLPAGRLMCRRSLPWRALRRMDRMGRACAAGGCCGGSSRSGCCRRIAEWIVDVRREVMLAELWSCRRVGRKCESRYWRCGGVQMALSLQAASRGISRTVNR